MAGRGIGAAATVAVRQGRPVHVRVVRNNMDGALNEFMRSTQMDPKLEYAALDPRARFHEPKSRKRYMEVLNDPAKRWRHYSSKVVPYYAAYLQYSSLTRKSRQGGGRW